MGCPPAPSPEELSITAAEVGTTQPWLMNISVRVSHRISSGRSRVSRWRVGTNDKTTSDTCERVLFPSAAIFVSTYAVDDS